MLVLFSTNPYLGVGGETPPTTVELLLTIAVGTELWKRTE